MSKGVKFMEASEQDLRNELKNMREENARIIKKEECSQALIKKLHDDFKAVKEDIKNSLQLKEENKSLKEEIAKRKLSSGGNQHPETQNLKNKIAEHRLTDRNETPGNIRTNVNTVSRRGYQKQATCFGIRRDE